MKIPRAIYEQLRKETGNRCGYCRTSTLITGEALTVEHLIPTARGGTTELHNLWLSCRRCNQCKRVLTEASDPETDQLVPLFDPRRQSRREHFVWSSNGTQIIGLTSTGRATIHALQMNHPDVVVARQLWVQVGWHPPLD